MVSKTTKIGIALGGIILIVVASTTLYLSDYRNLLDMNPNRVAVLIDYQNVDRLELVTRGMSYATNKEVLRWRYDSSGFKLYSNARLLVTSNWVVYTGTKKEVKASNAFLLSYKDDTSVFKIKKEQGFLNGTLIEEQYFTPNIRYFNFPEFYTTKFYPKDSVKHKLVWVLSDLRLQEGQKTGRIDSGCNVVFADQVKINWCNVADRFNYGFITKPNSSGKVTLSVYFNSVQGEQVFNIGLNKQNTLIVTRN